MNERFVGADELLQDSFQLAANIYEANFRPDFLVGLWRGGSAAGIYNAGTDGGATGATTSRRNAGAVVSSGLLTVSCPQPASTRTPAQSAAREKTSSLLR